MLRTVRGVLSTLIVLAVAGCHAGYKMPTLAEPHAVAKVRFVYHSTSGQALEQSILINDHALPVPPPAKLPGETAGEVLIRPEPAHVNVSATFSHAVTTTRPRVEQYACGSRQYECGNSMCTGVLYCDRTVPETYEARVGDGGCVVSAGLVVQQDAVYRLTYDYVAAGRCTLTCQREWPPQADGTLRLTPCEAPK